MTTTAPRAWVKVWGHRLHTSARVLGLPLAPRCAYVFLLATVGEDGQPRNPADGQKLNLAGLLAHTTLEGREAQAALLAMAEARLLYHDATGWRLWNGRRLQARVGARTPREELPDRRTVEHTLELIRGRRRRGEDPTPDLYQPSP